MRELRIGCGNASVHACSMFLFAEGLRAGGVEDFHPSAAAALGARGLRAWGLDFWTCVRQTFKYIQNRNT